MGSNKTVKKTGYTRLHEVDAVLQGTAKDLVPELFDKVDVRVQVGPLKFGQGFTPGRAVNGNGGDMWFREGEDGEPGVWRSRAVTELANYMFNLAQVKAFYVKGYTGLAATLVGLMVTAHLLEETEIDDNRVRGGFIRNPNDGEKAAFRRYGVEPNMKNSRCVGYFATDATDPKWARSAACLEDIHRSYRGRLQIGKDGNEMSAEEIVDNLRKVQKKVETSSKERSQKAADTTKRKKAEQKALGKDAKPIAMTLVGTAETLAAIDSLLEALYGFKSDKNDSNVQRANHVLEALEAVAALSGQPSTEVEQPELVAVNG